MSNTRVSQECKAATDIDCRIDHCVHLFVSLGQSHLSALLICVSSHVSRFASHLVLFGGGCKHHVLGLLLFHSVSLAHVSLPQGSDGCPTVIVALSPIDMWMNYGSRLELVRVPPVALRITVSLRIKGRREKRKLTACRSVS